MKKSNIMALVVGALMTTTMVPVSQQAFAEEIPEIIVTSPHVVTKQPTRPHYSLGTEEVLTTQRRVFFGDLNLRNPADIKELRMRIQTAAKDTCDHLKAMYPYDRDMQRDTSCRSDAQASAMDKAEFLIAMR